MVVVSKRVWIEGTDRVTDDRTIREALRTEALTTGNLDAYLDALQERGLALPNLRALVRHSFIFSQGKAHLALRRRVAGFFAPAAMERWRPTVIAAVETAISSLADASDPDLVHDYSTPVFYDVIGRVIGLDTQPPAELLSWLVLVNNITEPMLSMAKLRRIDTAAEQIARCLQQVPQRDIGLLGHLAPGADPLCPLSAPVHMSISVMIAAVTVQQTLSCALEGLLSQPLALWARIAEPAQDETVLDEMLSLYLSTLAVGRVADRDITVQGCPFAKGQTVILDIPAANYRLRTRQGDSAHMSFGSGHHKCLGETLARIVLAEALPRLARAFPHITLRHADIQQARTSIVQHPTALPCVLGTQPGRVNRRMVDIRDESQARAIVADETQWRPPQMVQHLAGLQDASDQDLSAALRIARNAPFFQSGPGHETTRRVVASVLGGAQIAPWRPMWCTQIDSALETLGQVQDPDLIRDFAEPLVANTLKAILGLRTLDPDRFNREAPEIQQILQPLLSLKVLSQLQTRMHGLLHLMTAPEPTPNSPPSLFETLAADPPDGWSPEDIKALILVLYGAGFNLRHTLGNILLHLLSLPLDHRPPLHDLDRRPETLEQLIALRASTKFIYRSKSSDDAPCDYEPNATARVDLAVVNRPGRPNHLSFGLGAHRCLGAALSRRVLSDSLMALFRRYPDLSLNGQLPRHLKMSQTVALAQLPCSLNAATRNTPCPHNPSPAPLWPS